MKKQELCEECDGAVPSNRFEICSEECYEIWLPKLFAALRKAFKGLPKVKLHL